MNSFALERVLDERAKRAMEVKVWVAKRRATWEPIMGPTPTMNKVDMIEFEVDLEKKVS